jgi:AraC-like DNA-binding protein
MPAAVQRVPFITLPNWIKAATLCGVDLQALLDELDIHADLGRLADSTVTPQQLARLMSRCVAETRQGHFPFVLGETYAFEYLPDLETFLTTSATLREASQVFEWVRALINPLLVVKLREAGGTARLVLDFLGSEAATPPPTQAWFTEALFAAILKFGRLLAPEGRDFRALDLRQPATAGAVDYAAHLRLPVRFGQAEDALCFERDLLDLPLGRSFPRLHAQARARVEAQLRRVLPREGLAAHIDQAFSRKPALLGLGAAAMAAELGLHLRSLQRRLQEEGLRYESLQEDARRRLAQQLLRTTEVDLDAISERLGYADRRSFTRAFKRWTGQTPSDWRQRSDVS